jgi:hypothetical protein
MRSRHVKSFNVGLGERHNEGNSEAQPEFRKRHQFSVK